MDSPRFVEAPQKEHSWKDEAVSKGIASSRSAQIVVTMEKVDQKDIFGLELDGICPTIARLNNIVPGSLADRYCQSCDPTVKIQTGDFLVSVDSVSGSFVAMIEQVARDGPHAFTFRRNADQALQDWRANQCRHHARIQGHSLVRCFFRAWPYRSLECFQQGEASEGQGLDFIREWPARPCL